MIELNKKNNMIYSKNIETNELSLLDKEIYRKISSNSVRQIVNKRLDIFLGDEYINNKVEMIRSKIFKVDLLILIFTILSAVFAVIATENYVSFELKPDEDLSKVKLVLNETSFVTSCRWIVSIFSGLNIILLLIHYIILLECEKAKMNLFPEETLYSTGWWKYLLVEILVNILHSPPYFNYKIPVYMMTGSLTSAEIQTDFFLTDWVLIFRSYQFLKFFAFHSKWSDYQCQKICLEAKASPSFLFAVKAEFKNKTFKLICFTLLLSIFIFGYSIRSIEMCFMNTQVLGRTQDWRYVWNGIWCIIITMTTVGFGDFYPISLVGRMISVISCLWGTFLISMMIAGLTASIEFTPQESISYEEIKSAQYDLEYGTLATKFIQASYRYSCFVRKSNENQDYTSSTDFRVRKSQLFLILEEALFEFRKIRAFKDENINLKAIEQSLQNIDILLNVDFETLKKKCIVMKDIEEILTEYLSVQKKIKQKSVDLFKEIEEINILKESYRF